MQSLQLTSDACASTVSDVAQRKVCEDCMNADAASSFEVCLYKAVHKEYTVTVPPIKPPSSLSY